MGGSCRSTSTVTSEAPLAQIGDRADGPLVEQRRKEDDQRAGGQRGARNAVKGPA
jgi:hypothetical protein